MSRSPAAPPHRAGVLYVVSTPIGNLRDITLRALDVLRSTELVVAEDTRHTRKLLSTFGIRARLVSLHARSPTSKLDEVIGKLLSGHDVSYVTDAGCPAISDPGSQLVDAARERGIVVSPIPGASALTAALACAGLPASDFRFLGFLPRSRGKRLTILDEATKARCALVLFESPRRVRTLLTELGEIVPDRSIALCREITKLHEEVLRGTAEGVLDAMPDQPRGEITIVVGPGHDSAETTDGSDDELIHKARALRRAGHSTRRAAQVLSGETGRPRKDIYRLIIEDEKEV